MDQRFALQWVKKYIHLFGGNPDHVTVFGLSAGAGSILHQITAYGGHQSDEKLFHQAIIQSPGFVPYPSQLHQEKTFRRFLEAANAKNLSHARQMSTLDLINANAAVILDSNYGAFTFGTESPLYARKSVNHMRDLNIYLTGSGPAVDGNLVPDMPGRLFQQRKFDGGINVMVGHTAAEV